MNIIPPYDDKEVFLRIAKGEERFFRMLFDRYKEKIYAFILKIVGSEPVAEDLTQEVFMRLWISRYALDRVETPNAFLFISARNRAFDHLRKEKKERSFDHPEKDRGENGTEETILFRESKKIIDQAIISLPEQQGKVYELARREGWSREQIATELGISPNTVRNHLAASIKQIKNFLAEHYEFWLIPFTLGILK